MPKILFTETQTVRQGDGLGPTYEKGKVYDLPVASCDRWKRRGVAVDAPEVEERPAPAAQPSPEPVRVRKSAVPAIERSFARRGEQVPND